MRRAAGCCLCWVLTLLWVMISGLPTGEQRRYLEDGDDVIVRGTCRRDGAARIGFGECRGVVLSALER